MHTVKKMTDPVVPTIAPIPMLNAQCDAMLRRKHIRQLFLGENDLIDRILFVFEVREIVVDVGREEHLCEWRY